MDLELIKKIGLWIITVFIAGLIGYFGRYLAMEIINRFKKNTEMEIHGKNNTAFLEKERIKSEKKILKNEYKLKKKIKNNN